MDLNQCIPIKTKRLFLDKFLSEDWVEYFKIVNSHEDQKHNYDKYEPRSESQIKEKIRKLSEQNYNKKKLPFLLSVRLVENKKLIGFVGLKNGKLEKFGQIEVYYSISKDFWNNGYGTETLKGIIGFGFKTMKLHRIFAGCDIDNLASKAVMEKAGMQFESYWRKDRFRNGKWADGLGFAILRCDYNRLKSDYSG